MNRIKKEEKRKYDEARKGLSAEKIKIIDKKEEKDNEIEKLAHEIHAEKFNEEYSYMYDSFLDKKDRENGINPLSKKYIDEINTVKELLLV